MFLFYKSQPKVYNKLDYILFSRKKVMTETKTDTQQQQMLRGTAWMTASNIISRLLGALYIIPWYAWMGKQGDQANALFGQGYNIYALFLLISTAGIPVAIAKQVSKYNTLGKMETSFFLLKRILYYMIGLGLIFGVFMYFASPWMSYLSGGDEDLVRVMRSLSWAVVIFPSMSVLRGFFQGFNNMKPYALSQIAEQIIRVIWMLLATFFIMKIGTGDYVTAVVQSTFAAFIGMLASYGVLFFYLWKEGKLKVKVSIDADSILRLLEKEVIRQDSIFKPLLIETIEDAYKRLIAPSVEREMRNLLTERAEAEAIKVFAGNTEKLLMVPPVRGKRIISIDPGFRTGCKVAVIDETGKLLAYTTIYPTEPKCDVAGTERTLKKIIDKYI